MKIRCTTLFDITKTNVSNRRQMLVEPDQNNFKQRSQQSNFETLLQIIGLRCQPEDITDPVKKSMKLDYSMWGTDYKSKSQIWCWTFTFNVPQLIVFASPTDPLGNLYSDCNGVPMIIDLDEWKTSESRLSISKENKNIHFNIEND